MTHCHLTLSREELHQIFTTNGKLAPSIMQSFLNQLLQKQASEQIQAEPYERLCERTTYRKRQLRETTSTRLGRITLHVPRLRNGLFSTELLRDSSVMKKLLSWLSWKWWYKVFLPAK